MLGMIILFSSLAQSCKEHENRFYLASPLFLNSLGLEDLIHDTRICLKKSFCKMIRCHELEYSSEEMGMESKYQGIQVFWLWTFIGFVIWPIYDFIKQISLQLFYFLTLSWSLSVWVCVHFYCFICFNQALFWCT